MKTIDKQQGFSETEALSKNVSGLPHPLNTAAFFMPKPQARAFHGGLIVGEYNTERKYPAAVTNIPRVRPAASHQMAATSKLLGLPMQNITQGYFAAISLPVTPQPDFAIETGIRYCRWHIVGRYADKAQALATARAHAIEQDADSYTTISPNSPEYPKALARWEANNG